MIVVVLKFIHVVGIVIWSAGLLGLPLLFVQRRGLQGDGLYNLHNFTRFSYLVFTSPAAFVAIASGTALIFLQSTFSPWFSFKLMLVALMVIIHVMAGLEIMHLFEPGERYPRWQAALVMTMTVCVISAVLVAVLGKPDMVANEAVADFFAPGSLSEKLSGFTAWWR